MRHLTGIVLAIVMAAGLFFAATWGYVRFAAEFSRLRDGASLYSDHHALLALGAMAAIGLLAGILIAAPRVSPLAAGLPGLLLLGLTALYLVSVHRADQLIPLQSHVFGAGFETLLARGILGAAALAMIVPLFVPSRWRGRGGADAADEFGPAFTEDEELVGVVPGSGDGVVPGSGDMPMAEATAGPDDSAASAEPTALAAGPARRSAGAAAPLVPVHHGGLPYRTRPPGIVY
jgi:hypothetical protein